MFWIKNDNRGYHRDSQSHTQHVCDTSYPAFLVTHTFGVKGNYNWLTNRKLYDSLILMNKFLATLLIGFFLISLPSWSGDLDKGFAAYDSGDYATALREWTALAEQGHAAAQYILGLVYKEGQVVPQDYNTVVKWWTLAAEQGNANAQSNLGVMYYSGQGVPQDFVYAHMWGNIASSNGIEDGAKLRDLVANQMTPSQLEKAQDLARACVAKEYKGC